jgi:hypothetical protein
MEDLPTAADVRREAAEIEAILERQAQGR